MPDATARELGEFGLIDHVVARLGTSPAVLLGPGDDAAVVTAPDGRVVATTDVLVEGVIHRLRALGASGVAELKGEPENMVFALPKELRLQLVD